MLLVVVRRKVLRQMGEEIRYSEYIVVVIDRMKKYNRVVGEGEYCFRYLQREVVKIYYGLGFINRGFVLMGLSWGLGIGIFFILFYQVLYQVIMIINKG